MQFTNPVIRGFHPDPSICRVGVDYFLATSSFEYFPGIPIFHSTDLVNWDQIGHCVTRSSQIDLSQVPDSGGLWAPTIRFHEGTFYVACTVLDTANFTNRLDPQTNTHDYSLSGRHFVVSSTDPYGQWSDPLWFEGAGFDPSLLFDQGRVFLTHAAGGAVLQSEIDLAKGQRVGDTRDIWRGTGEMSTEGPHLYAIGDYYYLIVAEGGTAYGHSIACARSKSPWGPWEEHPDNPLLSHRTHADDPVQATGHGDIVCDADGNWWVVFLAIRAQGYPAFHTLGRETFLAPVRWEDDWPYVIGPVTLKGHPAPGQPQRPHPKTWRADLSGPALEHEWNFLRTPDPRILVRDNRLILDSRTQLDSLRVKEAFVGVRQLEPACVAIAEFVIPDDNVGEFGLTVRMNGRHRYDLVVSREGSDLAVRRRRQIGSVIQNDRPVFCDYDNKVMKLTIKATPFAYLFTASTDRTSVDLGTAEAQYLSSEVAGGFTGVFFGLFAGDGLIAEALSLEITTLPPTVVLT